jgi:hypothetical protein
MKAPAALMADRLLHNRSQRLSDAYKKVFANCKPDLTPGEVTEAAHLAFAREGSWNNPKTAAGCDAVFGPMPRP